MSASINFSRRVTEGIALAEENALLGHSILVLAWATIYSTHQDYRGLLSAILVFGCLLCALWFMAALSGNAYHGEWMRWQSLLEDRLTPESQSLEPLPHIWSEHQKFQKTMKWYMIGVRNYFEVIPLLFVAIYISLGVYLWYPCWLFYVIGLTFLVMCVCFCIFRRGKRCQNPKLKQ